MNAVRSALTSLWFLLCLLFLPVLLLTMFNKHFTWWSVRKYMSMFNAGIAFLGGIRHKIVDDAEWQEETPDGTSKLYVIKHQSLWETLTFSIYRPNVIVIQKQELLDMPVFGILAKRCSMIGVRRSGGMSAIRQLLRDSKQTVQDGRDLAIYPEGTRVQPGVPMKMHPGAYAVYRDLGLTVVPVAHNSGQHWKKGFFDKRPGCITMEFLSPIEPGLDRKDFQSRVCSAIDDAMARLEDPSVH